MGESFSKDYKRRYLEAIGISPHDKDALTSAYNTAHRIREFEIELYWKRSAYIWAMQAALIGIAMFLRTSGNTEISIDFYEQPNIVVSTAPSASMLVSVVLVSLLAFCIAWLWRRLVEGAKFWQDNWERHVDLLGKELGQALYQTYPVSGSKTVPPFSVTKINEMVIWAFIVFWCANILWALLEFSMLFHENWNLQIGILFSIVILILGVLVLFILTQFANSVAFTGMRMDDIGERIDHHGNVDDRPALYCRK